MGRQGRKKRELCAICPIGNVTSDLIGWGGICGEKLNLIGQKARHANPKGSYGETRWGSSNLDRLYPFLAPKRRPGLGRKNIFL